MKAHFHTLVLLTVSKQCRKRDVYYMWELPVQKIDFTWYMLKIVMPSAIQIQSSLLDSCQIYQIISSMKSAQCALLVDPGLVILIPRPSNGDQNDLDQQVTYHKRISPVHMR